MVTDRHENEASRIESNDNTHRVADLGDLTQIMSRGQETKAEATLDQAMDAVTKMVSSFADRVAQLADTAVGKQLLDNIYYMAERGEPLYMLLRDQLKK
jgi:hypothetical protein